MKSYTDIEQIKKLAEILPIETADMWVHPYWDDVPNIGNADLSYNQIPCWSLAALIGILPEIQGCKPVITLDDNYITYPHMSGLHTKADNLVDACVAMIEKLHELKLL